MSALRIPASSPNSWIQKPCSFSAAVLSLVSASDRESLNHSPANLATRVDLPMPWGPASTSMVSNLTPGRLTLLMAAHSSLRVTARV